MDWTNLLGLAGHRAIPLCFAAAFGLVSNSTSVAEDIAAKEIEVTDVKQPVEIVIDRWGVPHIYATTLDDAFFAQGFQAARDRLWQIDLWRKRGLGQMAKDFGASYVEDDRMARAFLFRGDMHREWLAYGPDAEAIATAFVEGVNAFVSLTEIKPELLPLEFRLLGYKPAKWLPSDVVTIRHHGLTVNVISELDRAVAYCRGGSNGERIDWLRRELSPPIKPTIPAGLDVCAIPAAQLKTAYAHATARPRFSAELLPHTPTADRTSTSQIADAEFGVDSSWNGAGSNAWAIAGGKTQSGRPILASDPHRTHSAPSLRYVSHLVAPGLNVIGAGEPFLPGISIGHNESIAFGLTRFYIDQEDLYVYQVNPQNSNEYSYGAGFERMSVISELIDVRGEKSRSVEIKFTRHGPVLYEDRQNNRAYALRAAWLEPGMAPYFGSIEYMRLRSWDEFRRAMEHWGAPGETQIYADTSGNIGTIAAGLTPIRPNWDGLLPVPGNGHYEWAGFVAGGLLPVERNPERGYVLRANENYLPVDFPSFKQAIGYEWADVARSQRLTTLLSGRNRFTMKDSERMQGDTVSVYAQRMLKVIRDLRSDDPRVAQALQLLRSWNADEKADSASAALYEVWFSQYLEPAVLKAALGDDGARLAEPGDPLRIIMLLEEPDGFIDRSQRDAVLVSSLASAISALERSLGPDMRRWRWGDLHHARFEHALQAVAEPSIRDKLNIGAWPIGGSAYTPMATHYRPTDFMLIAGASFRMVVDVGDWDNSVGINSPGQSGDLNSKHYSDLVHPWLSGEYFPLAYTRAAVERVAESRIVLRPIVPR